MRIYEADFEATVANVPVICEAVTQAARSCGMDDANLWKLEISLDEAVTNIACYGYRDCPGEKIWLKWQSINGDFILTIEDAGVEFDQTKPTNPDFQSDLCDRKPGGLGRYIIHEFMDEFSYRRQNGRNILTMRKKLISEEQPQESCNVS